MKFHHTLITTTLLAGLLPAQAQATPDRAIDLAICLDTSGSMDGLLDSARHSIWAIVNDLALSKPTPKLRIALLTFGNNGHDKAAGWVKVDAPLTDDLDTVSQHLFALTTNGGDEYVGRVLQASLTKLDWSQGSDALKMIVVAGNEAADQDPEVDFRAMCSQAIGADVLVNAIYCGNPADQLAPVWREVAQRAEGRFAAIDQAKAEVAIATPFDDQLTALSASVNTTYLPYGQRGAWGAQNQVVQDENAGKLNGAVAAQRAVTKSCSNYANTTWDLVDACKAETVKIEDVADKDLPEAMRAMTLPERKAHIAAKQKERTAIQDKIAALNTQREAFVLAERKKRAAGQPDSFNDAVRDAVRALAEARGFRYAHPAAETVSVESAPAATEVSSGANGGR